VVIYDRIDYAPIFREGDLVVVSPESVRAVIEVKTDLTKQFLRSSLELIEEVSMLDDCSPPFFKGVFGFESELDAESLLSNVVEFYRFEPEGLSDLDRTHYIQTAYQHLTSLCVMGSVYGRVAVARDGSSGRLHPTLYSLTSATGLKTQAAHFLESLLLYLRFDGLKAPDTYSISEMLGADTQMTRVGRLTPETWGSYLVADPDTADGGETERLVVAVENWLAGRSWKAPQNPGGK